MRIICEQEFFLYDMKNRVHGIARSYSDLCVYCLRSREQGFNQ